MQAQDLPVALAGLLRQAETALRPATKPEKARKPSGTPASQKRALASATVLLLERAGSHQEGAPAVYQARLHAGTTFSANSLGWEGWAVQGGSGMALAVGPGAPALVNQASLLKM